LTFCFLAKIVTKKWVDLGRFSSQSRGSKIGIESWDQNWRWHRQYKQLSTIYTNNYGFKTSILFFSIDLDRFLILLVETFRSNCLSFLFRRNIQKLQRSSTSGWDKITAGIRKRFLRPCPSNLLNLQTRTDSSDFVKGPEASLCSSWNREQNSVFIVF